MSTIINPKKPVAVNPLKLSQPLGASLAFLGIKGIVPLFHGSQGCTAFAKVLLVRHFREAIPLATTAMTEVSTILGGEENVEEAILTLVEKTNPEIIGLLTTGLTETRGDDMQGILKTLRKNHPELDSLPIIFASTPDYQGSLENGYATAVSQLVATDYSQFIEEVPEVPTKPQVTILAGSLLSPGDIQEIKEITEDFGLTPLVVPDLADSLDGHLEDDEYKPVTPGGTSLKQLRNLEKSVLTIAIGESMRQPAEILQQRFGTKYEVFPRLVGLEAVDKFIWSLAQLKESPSIPTKYQRQRRQLQDAILDTHFYFGGKRVCLALEPDLLYQTSWLLKEMGVEIQGAVTSTKSPILSDLPIDTVTLGDLEDLQDLAPGSDLIITNSRGKNLAQQLHIPLYRMGYPIFDRLGNGQRCLTSYRGTMQFLFEVGNIFLEAGASH
jgi:nitrogenase molybdenum-iron protein NifN